MITSTKLGIGRVGWAAEATLASKRNGHNGPAAGLRPGPPRILLLAPLCHVGGYGQLLLALMTGAQVVLPEAGANLDLLDLAQEHEVTGVAGATDDFVGALLKSRSDVVRMTLRSLTINGRALAPDRRRDLAAAFPNLSLGAGYGLTETCGAVSIAADADIARRPGTCGRAGPTAQIRIVRENVQAGPHELGEIQIRGPMLATGYCAGPNALLPTLVDGWFGTKDLGWMDEDGFLYAVDRERDVIMTATGLVSCTMLEQIAATHPKVGDAVAFVRRDIAGQSTLAVGVVCGPEGDPAEIASFISCRVSGEPPVEVFRLETVARTRTGKIDRMSAASAAAERAARPES